MALRPSQAIAFVDDESVWKALDKRLEDEHLLNGDADVVKSRISEMRSALGNSGCVFRLFKDGRVDTGRLINAVACYDLPPGKVREYVTNAVRDLLERCLIRHY